MDQLPQEIINLIASFIERHPDQPGVPLWQRKVLPSNLPPYATISKSWRHAIERTVFREITLKSTEIKTLDAIFRGDRRNSLTKLTLDVVLPTYDEKACGRFERAADKKANDEAFTQAIEKLIAVLKSWEDASVGGRICLVLGKIFSPSDASQRDFETLQQQRYEAEVGKHHDLFEHRYKHSPINLLRPDSLPSLLRISKASLGNSNGERSLSMRAVVDMTAKLPNLESFGWELYDNEKRYPNLRLTNRDSFASTLSTYTFPSVKTAEITFYHEAPLNQRMKPTNLLGGHTYDPLSTALLRTFSQSQNLTSLTLTGVFDSSLFWLSNQSPSTPVPSWPALKSLTVTFDLTTPSGHWYFTDPSGSDPEDVPTLPAEADDSEDSPVSDEDSFDEFDFEEDARVSGVTPANAFRTVPNPSHVNPLVLAYAKGLRHMPSLLTSALTTGPVEGPDGPFQFEICYYAPDQMAYYGDEGIDDQKFRRLYFEVRSWVPDEEVLGELREVGRSRWGDGLVERFLDGQY